jgi:hypothetical protein
MTEPSNARRSEPINVYVGWINAQFLRVAHRFEPYRLHHKLYFS